jgi:hypothetical protein
MALPADPITRTLTFLYTDLERSTKIGSMTLPQRICFYFFSLVSRIYWFYRLIASCVFR